MVFKNLLFHCFIMKGKGREYKDEAKQLKTKPFQALKFFSGACIYQGQKKS